ERPSRSAGDSTYQVDATEHVAPLIGSADLELDTVILFEAEEVMGLQQHVGELGEGDALIRGDPSLHRFTGEHRVDRDVLADVTEKVKQGDRCGPVTVVDELCGLTIEWHDPVDLLADRRNVVCEGRF